MSAGEPVTPSTLDQDGRPAALLPVPQLVRLSLYWLGLSSIFAGLTNILGNRLQFTGLVSPGTEGTTLFELTIGGMEVAPAYSEQNDPDVQREMFEKQAGEEKQNIDQDFLLALEHGMPPAGGMGVGIDRLCILLTGAESIRDVILFPQLRPGGGA